MSLSRIELDGFGSPAAIAARIHELAADLGPGFDVEAICRQLDIVDIRLISTTSFEAMLIMDEHKALGAIALREESPMHRRRFSIGHELGHFLLPTHLPTGRGFSCSVDDLRHGDPRDADRRKRVEAEANRFAAELLMPPRLIRANMRSRQPDLAEIVRLAAAFKVSKEAMARAYVEAHRDELAIVILHNGRVDRIYRPATFPWIDVQLRQCAPSDSVAADHGLAGGEISEVTECDPETWLGERGAGRVEVLCEQVLAQAGGYAMVLLHAELADDR